MRWIDGRLVSDYEVVLLRVISANPGQPAHRYGADGWQVLRSMTSLEAKGLVKRNTDGNTVTWETTDVYEGVMR